MLQTHFRALKPLPHCQVESFYRLLVVWQEIWSEQIFCATLITKEIHATAAATSSESCSGAVRHMVQVQKVFLPHHDNLLWEANKCIHNVSEGGQKEPRQVFRKIKKFLLKTMAENIVHKSKWKLKGCTAPSYYTNTYQKVRGDLILVYKAPTWESHFWEYCHLNQVGKDTSTKQLESEARSKMMQHQRWLFPKTIYLQMRHILNYSTC